MPINRPPAPAAALAVFSNSLPAFLSGPNYGSAGNPVAQAFAGPAPAVPSPADVGMGGGDIPDPPRIQQKQQIFVLTLADAAHNTGTISPYPSGWRIFAGGDAGKTVSGRMVQSSVSGVWKLISVAYGTPVLDQLNASAGVDALPEAEDGSYELRTLDVPAVNARGIWLKALSDGAQDLILPSPTGAAQLIPALSGSPVFTLADFLTAIRPLAINNLAMQASQGA